MQEDPFLILGLDRDADDDEAIKRTYLTLVRQFSPERDPARFQDIRTAYEAVRDRRGRLRARLLRPGRSGVAHLKRSLLQSGLQSGSEGIADQPGRASWKTVEAVLLEGLITAVRRQLAGSLPPPSPPQEAESGNHPHG